MDLYLANYMEHWAYNWMDTSVLAALQFYNLQYHFAATERVKWTCTSSCTAGKEQNFVSLAFYEKYHNCI
jgi:hypothetical protein